MAKDIPKEYLQARIGTMTFEDIAIDFGCSTVTVRSYAKYYGLMGLRSRKAEKPGELEAIRAMHAQGWSVIRIANAMNRSQEFVCRRVKRIENPELMPEAKPKELPAPSSRSDWPERTTTDHRALKGKIFEDMPASQRPEDTGRYVDGARYARSFIQASIGTSSAMCADA